VIKTYVQGNYLQSVCHFIFITLFFIISKKNHLSPAELGQVVKTTIDNKGK